MTAPTPNAAHDSGPVENCTRCVQGGLVSEMAWRECAHRADYDSAAHHERGCPFHNGEVDENGLTVDPS